MPEKGLRQCRRCETLPLGSLLLPEYNTLRSSVNISFREEMAFATKPKTVVPTDIHLARSLLRESENSRDQLPYTTEFERLKKRYTKLSDPAVSDSEFWQLLTRVGKRGGLGRDKSKRIRVPSRKLTTEQQLALMRLLPDGIGSCHRLPYTKEFDRIHRQFSEFTRTRLDAREFWRALSRVAKLLRKPEPLFQAAPLGGLDPDVIRYLESQNPWWCGHSGKAPPLFRRGAFRGSARPFSSRAHAYRGCPRPTAGRQVNDSGAVDRAASETGSRSASTNLPHGV